MRPDAKKEAADELKVQEKVAADELSVKESSEDSALGGMRTRETEWGQELAKTITSTIAGMATQATNSAKTSQRESWTKTALGHEQERREGRVSCASRLRTCSECDGGSNSDCFKRAQNQRSESKGVPMLHRWVSSVTRRRSSR